MTTQQSPIIIIGLGNPGSRYAATRHNAGFWCVEHLAQLCDPTATFIARKKCHATIARLTCGGVPIILVKPLTFMNRSGDAARATIAYYKTRVTDLIVVHDDLDVRAGHYKVSRNVRAAGHNGVQSVIDALGTQNFTRVRVGVEHPEGRAARGPIAGDDYVLRALSADDAAVVREGAEQAARHLAATIKTPTLA